MHWDMLCQAPALPGIPSHTLGVLWGSLQAAEGLGRVRGSVLALHTPGHALCQEKSGLNPWCVQARDGEVRAAPQHHVSGRKQGGAGEFSHLLILNQTLSHATCLSLPAPLGQPGAGMLQGRRDAGPSNYSPSPARRKEWEQRQQAGRAPGDLSLSIPTLSSPRSHCLGCEPCCGLSKGTEQGCGTQLGTQLSPEPSMSPGGGAPLFPA